MREPCQGQPHVCPPFIGTSACASTSNTPAMPRGPDPPPAAPSLARRAPRLAWLLEWQSVHGGDSDNTHRVMVHKAMRPEVCRGRNGPGQSVSSIVCGCLIAWWHKRGQATPCPAVRAGGCRSTAGREDEPGGRLQPACEATAGLACVCPDRRAPARPLMGKACGQTSGSGTGNTQSIIRASGFLQCLTPASPECRCPPCRPPGTRRSGKGRRNVQ